MGILRISFHRGTLKSYIRFFPNLEFLHKTAGDPGGREEQGSLRRDRNSWTGADMQLLFGTKVNLFNYN